MTTATHHLTPKTHASTRETRRRELTLHVGTFADGQRAVPLRASYSVEIGSFGDADRK
jgi:hypothetical protein